MSASAVIETGGKQYRVEPGNTLEVEKLDAEVGSNVELDRVLALSNGKTLQIGTPTVESASVKAKVLDHFRGKKLINFKKKRRKGYKRKIGHRQSLTKIEITQIA